MSTKFTISSPDEINIDSNAVIEASAGTGKTYTIIKLISRILMEGKAELSEIVVVTFTEKATSELKEKIRNELESKLNDPHSGNKKIKSIYENFGELNIYTIHAFCNKLLNEYSFETGIAFENDLVNDAALFKKIFYIQLRKKWFDIYRENLNRIIEISNFYDNPESFEETAIDVISKLRPFSNNKIFPGQIDDLKKLKDLLNRFEDNINDLIMLIGEVNEDHSQNLIFQEYEELDKILKAASKKTRIAKIIFPLLDFSRESKINGRLISFNKFYKVSSNCCGFDRINEEDNSIVGYKVLLERKKKNFENYSFEENNPKIFNLVNVLEKLRIDYEKLRFILLSNTVENSLHDIREFKKTNSLISYDDMLSLLNNSLDKNNKFLSIIQGKYKYALFDEFQDTDATQWEIFRKIFLINKKNKLFIIGDPKQSIYGFRNADIKSYNNSKSEMLDNHNANLYTLSTNFRSTEKLINIFNSFFSSWFDKKEISTIIPPSDKSKIPGILFKEKKRDDSGISVFDLTDVERNHRTALSNFIVNEIKYLLMNSDKIEIIRKDNIQYKLNENDICILVRKAKDADFISEQLSKNSIKSTFYKKAGLFQTTQALNIKYILGAIAFPGNLNYYKQALLTDFFKIKIKDLNNQINYNNDIKLLFEKWFYLSEKRNWKELFYSILYDTGILYRIAYLSKSADPDQKILNHERIITNYRHIFEKLEDAANNQKLDIYKLTNYLNNLITSAVVKEREEDLQRNDSEENKVKIVTIHAGKGLEFPFVFLFTNFSKNNKKNFYKFHEGNDIIFDVAKNILNKAKHESELLEEEKRIYYVACTRAIYKLYLPLFNNDKLKNKSKVIDFINCSINENIDKNFFIKKNDFQFQEFSKHEIEKPALNEKIFIKELFPEIDYEMYKRKITIHSFSSLNYQYPADIKAGKYNTLFGEENKEEDEIHIEESDEEQNLPSSNLTGIMFHEILEKISFKKTGEFKSIEDFYNDRNTFDLINYHFNIYLSKNNKNYDKEKRTSFLKKTVEIIFNTLKTGINEENLRLSDLNDTDKLHEVEFYLPVSSFYAKMKFFLNGFIDMVFKSGNKYCLADWKSNYLKNGYSGEAFFSEVKEHYDLQYKIYLIAYLEWLKKYVENFNYNADFGGIYYIYLRGIGADKQDNKNGIFFYKPEEDEIIKIKNEINLKIFEKLENN